MGNQDNTEQLQTTKQQPEEQQPEEQQPEEQQPEDNFAEGRLVYFGAIHCISPSLVEGYTTNIRFLGIDVVSAEQAWVLVDNSPASIWTWLAEGECKGLPNGSRGMVLTAYATGKQIEQIEEALRREWSYFVLTYQAEAGQTPGVSVTVSRPYLPACGLYGLSEEQIAEVLSRSQAVIDLAEANRCLVGVPADRWRRYANAISDLLLRWRDGALQALKHYAADAEKFRPAEERLSSAEVSRWSRASYAETRQAEAALITAMDMADRAAAGDVGALDGLPASLERAAKRLGPGLFFRISENALDLVRSYIADKEKGQADQIGR